MAKLESKQTMGMPEMKFTVEAKMTYIGKLGLFVLKIGAWLLNKSAFEVETKKAI